MEYIKTGERDGLICLRDEQGNQAMFDFLALAAADGNEYAALLMEGDDEVTVLRFKEGENGDERYYSIEDDAEFALACERLAKTDEDLFE